jgi:hypothetical protein
VHAGAGVGARVAVTADFVVAAAAAAASRLRAVDPCAPLVPATKASSWHCDSTTLTHHQRSTIMFEPPLNRLQINPLKREHTVINSEATICTPAHLFAKFLVFSPIVLLHAYNRARESEPPDRARVAPDTAASSRAPHCTHRTACETRQRRTRRTASRPVPSRRSPHSQCASCLSHAFTHAVSIKHAHTATHRAVSPLIASYQTSIRTRHSRRDCAATRSAHATRENAANTAVSVPIASSHASNALLSSAEISLHTVRNRRRTCCSCA